MRLPLKGNVVGRKITLTLGILMALVFAVPAIATTPDDLDQHVSIVDCTGTVTRSGRTLEVWVPDLDGEKVTTLDNEGDSWSTDGPATFTVVLRTVKQVSYKTYTVPGGCDEPTTTTIAPTTTTVAPCNPNSVPCWCDDGVKIEPGGYEWVADANYDLVVVKGGSVDYGDGPGNLVYYNVQAGDVLVAPLNAGGQQSAISHIILCGKEVPPSTTVPPDTSTSSTTSTVAPPTSSTTTTVTSTTTSTIVPPDTSSTLGPPDTTSTTQPQNVTTTTVPGAPTTNAPGTTTPDTPNTDDSSTDCGDGYAVNEDGDCILPITGANDEKLSAAAAAGLSSVVLGALMALGAALGLFERRRGGKGDA